MHVYVLELEYDEHRSYTSVHVTREDAVKRLEEKVAEYNLRAAYASDQLVHGISYLEVEGEQGHCDICDKMFPATVFSRDDNGALWHNFPDGRRHGADVF
jgi:hypothetical protein